MEYGIMIITVFQIDQNKLHNFDDYSWIHLCNSNLFRCSIVTLLIFFCILPIVISGLLNSAEMKRLTSALEKNKTLPKYLLSRDDNDGRKTNLTVWNHPGDDVAGMVARCEKVVNTMEEVRMNCHVCPYTCDHHSTIITASKASLLFQDGICVARTSTPNPNLS